MAYFQQRKNSAYTRQFADRETGNAGRNAEDGRMDLPAGAFDEYDEEEFDDGFDEIDLEPEDSPQLEEDSEARRLRFRIAAGAADLTGVLAGVVVIGLLISFLIAMIRFVSSDLSQSFTLLRTKI